MKNFSDRLRESLKRSGMKQIELSRRSGVDRSDISHYLRGDYLPKLDRVERLASALGVSVSYLAGYTDDPNPTGDPGLDSFLDTFTRMTQPDSFGSVSVSADELKLILAFRDADPAIQSAVRKLLDLGGDR